jgi:hypothetical protein
MFKRLMQRFMLLEGEVAGDTPAGGASAAAPSAAEAAPSTEAAPSAAPTPPGNLVAEATATGGAEAKPDGDAGGKDGEPPGEKKEGEAATTANAEPAEYAEFQLPEGVQVDEQKMADFKAKAREAGLSQEQAQKLVDVHTNAIKAASDASTQLWYDTQKEWQQQVIKDPEIGGKNFEPMKETVAKAIDTVGGEDAQKIRQAFEYTGAGNNPDIIRFLYRLGKAIGEGGAVGGGMPAAVEQPKSAAERLYPNQKS